MDKSAIRRGVPSDVEAVADLHATSRRSAYQGLVADEIIQRLSMEEGRIRWTVFLSEQSALRCWIAEMPEGMAGFILVGPSGDDGRPTHGEVCALHVATNLRGDGIGRRLLDVATVDMAQRHAAAVLWVVRDNVGARRFYEREGWVADGATRDDPWYEYTVPEVRYARPLS